MGELYIHVNNSFIFFSIQSFLFRGDVTPSMIATIMEYAEYGVEYGLEDGIC